MPDDEQSTGGGAQDEPRDEPLKSAAERLAELREYASYYIAARLDAAKLSVRRAVTLAALGIIAVLVATVALAAAVVVLLIGVAHGVGAMFEPDRPWAGELIVGVGVLAGIGTGLWLVLRRLTSASRRRTVAKYEQRQSRQRSDFGHDVGERAGGGGETRDRN